MLKNRDSADAGFAFTFEDWNLFDDDPQWLDATLGTPYNVRPVTAGIDYVLHSATKYLGGHNDLLAGVIVGPAEKLEPVRKLRGVMGSINSPHNAFLLARGLKTFELRMERHNQNGLAVARFLASHPRVERVGRNRDGRAQPVAEMELLDVEVRPQVGQLLAHCHLGLGKLHGRTGKREQAREPEGPAERHGLDVLAQAMPLEAEVGDAQADQRERRVEDRHRIRDREPVRREHGGEEEDGVVTQSRQRHITRSPSLW